MTPKAPKTSPNAIETPAKWVSVSEAAAARRCSIRTVKRWIENGELESRKDGGRRLVLLLDSGAERDTEGTQQKGHNPGGVSLLAPFDARKEGHSEGTQDAQPVSLLALSGGESNDRETELLRDSLASERAQTAFLRGVIEQLQRDSAETRAALRKALDLTPKQLTAGASSTKETDTKTGPESLRSSSTNDLGAANVNGRQNAPESRGAVSYGDIADWLESETLGRK